MDEAAFLDRLKAARMQARNTRIAGDRSENRRVRQDREVLRTTPSAPGPMFS